MPAFICSTCGTQYPASEAPPARCPVCEDERQFIPPEGQSWTTLERLRISHHNGFRQYEPGLIGIGTTPKFAIGQRALLLCTPEGNILWDCISLIDDATITIINRLGGLCAIAISHPHFYTTLVDWSRAFGNVPVYLHADDADWVRQPDSCIKFWQGDRIRVDEGYHAHPRWRTFPWRSDVALGGGRWGKGRPLLGGYGHRQSGSQIRFVHAQHPKLHSPFRKGRPCCQCGVNALRIRSRVQPPLGASDRFRR